MLCLLAELHSSIGASVSRADDDRDLALYFLHYQLQQSDPLFGQQRVSFAGVPKDTEAVGAGFYQVVNQCKLTAKI